MEPQIINGPIAPSGGGLIYQVTLESGAVLTNPGAFPDDDASQHEVNAYIAHDGRLLILGDVAPS